MTNLVDIINLLRRFIKNKAIRIAVASRIILFITFAVTLVLMAPDQLTKTDLPFVSMFTKWDSAWYQRIAIHGYPFKDAMWDGSPPLQNWAFFPLYPALMRLFASFFWFQPYTNLDQATMISGFIISNICFLLSALFIYKLSNKLFNNTNIAQLSVVFFSFFISSNIFSMVYSESLFIFLTITAFYFLENNKLLFAVPLAVLASFTRSNGFLVFVPFAIAGIQALISNKITIGYKQRIEKGMLETKKALKLFGSSIIIASPYFLWNLLGNFVIPSANIGLISFPIQMWVHDNAPNWGAAPPLITQFQYAFNTDGIVFSIYSEQLPGATLALASLIIVFIPLISLIKTKATTLKYWGFYGAMIYVIFTTAWSTSITRYLVVMVPIFWEYAVIANKFRRIGLILISVIFVMFLITSFLLALSSPLYT